MVVSAHPCPEGRSATPAPSIADLSRARQEPSTALMILRDIVTNSGVGEIPDNANLKQFRFAAAGPISSLRYLSDTDRTQVVVNFQERQTITAAGEESRLPGVLCQWSTCVIRYYIVAEVKGEGLALSRAVGDTVSLVGTVSPIGSNYIEHGGPSRIYTLDIYFAGNAMTWEP